MDIQRKRISLSMKDDSPITGSKKSDKKVPSTKKEPELEGDMQAKLAQLMGKFKI